MKKLLLSMLLNIVFIFFELDMNYTILEGFEHMWIISDVMTAWLGSNWSCQSINFNEHWILLFQPLYNCTQCSHKQVNHCQSNFWLASIWKGLGWSMKCDT